MTDERVDYPLASASWDSEELAAIQSVIDSGFYTMGSRVRQFEKEFADYIGVKYAVMVNSGSSANLIGVQGVLYHPESPLKPGDAVIVPAVSWSTTYFPLHQAGLEMRFVDIDAKTLNMDIKQVRQAAKQPNVKAIFAVNLLGRSCDFSALQEIAHENGLLLMEDNCEGFGASHKGRKTGSFGIFGSFSFFFSHHLVTMEGGMLTTDDKALYCNALALRAHGWTREQPEGSHLELDEPEFTKKFRFVLPGYNLRPLEMSGAIGSVQLKKADSMIDIRRQNAKRFYELFSSLKDVMLPDYDPDCTWFGYALMINNLSGDERDDLANRLSRAGIETRPILSGNFLNNPVIEMMKYSVHGSLDVAEMVDTSGLFFGAQNHPLDKELILARDIVSDFVLSR